MAIRKISTIFRNIIIVLQINNDVEMNNDNTIFPDHMKDNLVNEKDGNQNHLSVPVYSYTKPTMGV